MMGGMTRFFFSESILTYSLNTLEEGMHVEALIAEMHTVYITHYHPQLSRHMLGHQRSLSPVE